MKVLEHSEQRLRLRLSGTKCGGTGLTLDRTMGRVEIVRFAWIFPCARQQIAFSDIADIAVRKWEEDGNRACYKPVLHLNNGRSVEFACGSKADAMETLRLVGGFLKPR